MMAYVEVLLFRRKSSSISTSVAWHGWLKLCRNTRRSFKLHTFWSGLLVPIPISMPLLGKTDLPTGGGNLSSDPNPVAFERAA
ncbi:hypothetical protein ACFX2C_044361 [Malus domestica]